MLGVLLRVLSALRLSGALAPAGGCRGTRVASTYAAAMARSSYIHGTLYPWVSAFNAADRADPGSQA